MAYPRSKKRPARISIGNRKRTTLCFFFIFGLFYDTKLLLIFYIFLFIYLILCINNVYDKTSRF